MTALRVYWYNLPEAAAFFAHRDECSHCERHAAQGEACEIGFPLQVAAMDRADEINAERGL